MTYVPPSGPARSGGLAIFGESPDFEDQIEGRGFVGKAGQELWAGFERHGIPGREYWYVSNIVKDGLPNNRDPKPAEIYDATPVVLDELLSVKPRVIVTAGAFATRFFLGDVGMSNAHGIPHTVVLEGHEYVVVPIYHPAAGLHKKGYLAAFDYDLGRVAGFLRGELGVWQPSGCPAIVAWLREPPKRRLTGTRVAVDTEGWPDKPWGLSFTVDGVHAYVIPAMFPAALEWFSEWLDGRRVVMHNGLHDLPVLRALGVEVGEYDDTMVMAYHEMLRTGSGVLEGEAQNLGTLAYRACGMTLRELSDLPGVDFEQQEIPYTEAVKQYAGEDVLATWHLFDRLQPECARRPYQIDMGQVRLVEEMIRHGMPFEYTATEQYFEEVVKKEELARRELQRTAREYGMHDFNPGSHPQVRELLTNRLRLRIRKRTKGGLASTSEKAIAIHAGDPTVKLVQTYRELDKLRGTYLAPLLEALR